MNIADLSAEFPRESVHWRVQGTPYERNGKHSAMALAYIDARDVMDKLDAVCGPAGWQDQYEVTGNGLIICRIGIKIGDEWVWKSDGAGETAVEGKKGGMSDALKRCAVKWGVGRYLYRLDSPWVQCEVKKRNGKTYWKEWSEDPWSKAKTTTYQLAEKLQAESAFEASCQAAIRNIGNEPDLDSLGAYWQNLNSTERAVAADIRVIEAKDARKLELDQKEVV